MRKHWKKIVIGVVAIIAVVLGGSFIYAKFFNDAPDALDAGDLSVAVAGTDGPGTSDAPTATNATGATAAPTTDSSAGSGDAATSTGVDGTWVASTADSILRYRVKESINGFDAEAVGQTNQITGTLTLEGTTATVADFTVDMTTFSSDKQQRDNQFDGRVMQVDQFPTSTFTLTKPIDFGSIPANGEQISVEATGDLTLHGVTKSVTFELTATFDKGRVGVLGNIPVVFSDYDIDNPSFGSIKTEDHGLLEFILVFDPAPAA